MGSMDSAPNPEPKPEPAPTVPAAPWSRNLGYPPYYGGYRRPGVCDQPPAVGGPCEAYIPRWTFNQATRNCEQFIYGGCKGNKNRFGSKAECEKKCSVTFGKGRYGTETNERHWYRCIDKNGNFRFKGERWSRPADDGCNKCDCSCMPRGVEGGVECICCGVMH